MPLSKDSHEVFVLGEWWPLGWFHRRYYSPIYHFIKTPLQIATIGMNDIPPQNAESESQMKTRAMKMILDRICSRYLQGNQSPVSLNEIIERVKGLGPGYAQLNTRDIALGSGLINIVESGLTLNEKGNELCKEGKLTL